MRLRAPYLRCRRERLRRVNGGVVLHDGAHGAAAANNHHQVLQTICIQIVKLNVGHTLARIKLECTPAAKGGVASWIDPALSIAVLIAHDKAVARKGGAKQVRSMQMQCMGWQGIGCSSLNVAIAIEVDGFHFNRSVPSQEPAKGHRGCLTKVATARIN